MPPKRRAGAAAMRAASSAAASGVCTPQRPPARIAFDEHGQRAGGIEGGGEAVDGRRAVGNHAEACHALVQGAQPRQFRRAENVIGDENIFEAGIGENFCLADLLAVDADGAGCALGLGHRDDLVRLDMRAECLAVLVEVSLRAADVGGEPVLVDHGHGGENLVERRADFGPGRRHGKPSGLGACGACCCGSGSLGLAFLEDVSAVHHEHGAVDIARLRRG
jgi:hypothetical protein